MKEITINNINYEIIENNGDAIDIDLLAEKITDYFDGYDYIVGDWAYSKLRLKGFYDSNNKNCKEFNDIANIKDYLDNKCAYGCRWFSIKRK